MDQHSKTKREVVRIGKHLNEIITINDSLGNVIHKVTKPLMIEVYPRDIMQLIIGATLLSTPLALTDEVWKLGETLPLRNAVLLATLSITFISLFVYHNFYRQHLREHVFEFFKRILLVYLVSGGICLLMLYLFKSAHHPVSWVITLKRMIIIAFPASMSATVADMLK